MQSDLCSAEDMSFMTYSEPQLFSFYHRNKPREKHPQLERQCMAVAVEGDSFLEATVFSIGSRFRYMSVALEFKPKETELHPQYQNWIFCASSVSSLPIKAAELPTRTAG